ncbi:MAG: endonuclease/exonuclease/phosphatase family protein [Deltaproteobacteria bacterium]|nr:endonuclease/exonuclease/phosphatase family protein [Deltaproteobacteria bacterium]
MPRVLFALLFASSCAACGPQIPKTLGELPLDKVALGGTPILAYLQDALADGRERSVAQLFVEEKIEFGDAPDPSPLFARRFDAARAAAPPRVAQPLKVLSYNVGLLDRAKILGFIDRVAVPEIEARRAVIADAILGRGYDVLLLQEVWELRDVDAFREAAVRHGYRCHGGSDANHPAHGLLMLVKESIIDADAGEEQYEIFYEVQYDLESFPGPGMRRAYLTWRLTTSEGIPLRLFDTHLTAFEEHWRVRMAQARELGLAVAASPDSDVIVLGGDLNAAPYYADSTWRRPDGSEFSEWWHNAISYPLLLFYGDLQDALVSARPAQDVELGRLVPYQPDTEIPYGSPGYCERTPPVVFTATDCNSLSLRSYGGQAPPERIDYVMYRATDRPLYVAGAELVFTERRAFPGAGTFELSDHYGVLAELHVETR